MRRTLWWAERLALLLFAAILLPGATSAASAPVTSAEVAVVPEPARASVVIPSTDDTTTSQPSVPMLAMPPAPAAPTPAAARIPAVEAQIVALYGYPGIPAMGALGAYEPDDAAIEAARLARQFDAANGSRYAVGALQLITSVAQPYPMADGSYLGRMSTEQIATYVEVARRHGVLLILDLQIGMADPVAELQRLRPFLAEPFVHIALDPEFAMQRKGGQPGERIGSLDASDVNRVSHELSAIVSERGLPGKLLVLHQFRADMLTSTEQYENFEGVTRIVDMDGWGAQWIKLANYDSYSLAAYSQRPGIKLFYDWDQPLLSVEQLLALPRMPDLVIYQ